MKFRRHSGRNWNFFPETEKVLNMMGLAKTDPDGRLVFWQEPA
jgi:hypothetical protein